MITETRRLNATSERGIESENCANKITKLSKQKEENESNENVSEDKTVPKEKGGPKGLEPTRYGDWEKAGRCSDF